MPNIKQIAAGLLSALATATVPAYTITDGTATLTGLEFSINDPETRIDFTEMNGDSIIMEAIYLGPTDNTALLASGAWKEQFGVKLRNLNTCNVVYVMRQFKPIPSINIMYKQNIGMSTHEQCGDKGYVFVKDIPLPVVPVGTKVVLGAKFVSNTLFVLLNGQQVWKGYIPFTQTGISGFRSDNTKVKFKVAQ
jgi:hypothetical protein